MIYYIGYYDCEQISQDERHVSLAAANKMNYLLTALEQTGEEVIELVSVAETKKHTWVGGCKRHLSGHITMKTFPSISSRFKLIRALGHLMTRASFLLYLLTHITSTDQMIVYHSLQYMKMISLVHKVTKCRLIMEVEEIYADVNEDTRLRRKEIEFLRNADKYIFITELIRDEISTKKDSVIFHGTYRAVPEYGVRFQDGKTHVVYAGTFHPVKGGVFQAISAAEFLDESYVLHILGGGSSDEVRNVQEKIVEMSEKIKCEIHYDGYKTGAAFDAYIQACHIGLSTQQAGGKFNATSFPSKILMYMSNGIHVVSVRIPAVESSLVGGYVYYYDNQEPRSIADAIRAVPRTDESVNRILLERLHTDFVNSLRQLLGR